MALVMTPIYTQTVGSGGASSVTFNNIPQYYTDLKVVCSIRSLVNDTNGSASIQLNTTTSGYSSTALYGSPNIPATTSYRLTSQSSFQFGYTDCTGNTANTFSSHDIYIPNYTSTNYKQMIADSVTENNASLGYAQIYAGLSNLTSAISSIKLIASYGNFDQYSTFSLYGIIRYGA